MRDEIAISFPGPFSWFGASDAPAVYGADEVRQCGIYLWTVRLALGYVTAAQIASEFGVQDSTVYSWAP
jgi:hypothetical protein